LRLTIGDRAKDTNRKGTKIGSVSTGECVGTAITIKRLVIGVAVVRFLWKRQSKTQSTERVEKSALDSCSKHEVAGKMR
jgi:hypothetical protein